MGFDESDIKALDAGDLQPKLWKRPSQAEYRQERKRAKLPKDYKCPVCEETVLDLRKWVTKEYVVCRSCHQRIVNNERRSV
jgi:transcription elongation factor Elf1